MRRPGQYQNWSLGDRSRSTAADNEENPRNLHEFHLIPVQLVETHVPSGRYNLCPRNGNGAGGLEEHL